MCYLRNLLLLLLLPLHLLAQDPAQDGQPAPSPTAINATLEEVSPIVSEFVVTRPSQLSGRLLFSATIGGFEQLLVLDLDGRQVRRLISGKYNNSYPDWSPDGASLVFSSDRDGNREIYQADWDGRNQKRLTNNKVADDNPAFAPDGKRIVYYSETGGKPSSPDTNLFILDLGTLKSTQITSFNGRNITPVFSRDGQNLAYSTNRYWPGWDICLWSFNTGNESCVLRGTTESYCRPAWAPTGRQIAYSHGSGRQIDIASMNLDDQKVTELTHLELREYDAAWSASGDYLAFVAENGSTESFNIYLWEKSTQKTSLLAKSPYPARYLSWSAIPSISLEGSRMLELQRQAAQGTPEAEATTRAEPADSEPR